MLALQWWIFTLDWTTFVSFLFGIVIGVILLALIYAMLVLMSIRDKKFSKVADTDSLSEKEAKEMIAVAIQTLNDKNLRGKKSKSAHFGSICYDLVYGIASRLFPNSKYPMFEITIDEGIEMMGYVQTRLNDLLDKKMIKLVKKFTIARIVSLTRASKAVTDSKAFNVGKEVTKTATTIKKVVDVINPINWVKRLFVNTTITLIMNKIYEVTLEIVGEEAFKIYSKACLHMDVDIESDVDLMIEDLEQNIKKEITKESARKNSIESGVDTLDLEASGMRFKTVSYKLKSTDSKYETIYKNSFLMKKENKEEQLLLETTILEEVNDEKERKEN